jgi:hypothetical protein
MPAKHVSVRTPTVDGTEVRNAPIAMGIIAALIVRRGRHGTFAGIRKWRRQPIVPKFLGHRTP